MDVNVGCGEFPAAGWVNVDIVAQPDGPCPDVIASALDLPFEDGSANRVYLGHVLEHLTMRDAGKAIREAFRVAGGDGAVLAVGPDCDVADRMRWSGILSREEHRAIVHGAGRWASDVHLWRCTAGLLHGLMSRGSHRVREVQITSSLLDPWPVTSRIGWQGAVIAQPYVF